MFRADERGHHPRDVLIMEEDIKNKFVKWSLKKAKSDEPSADAARDFLNDELLCGLEACGCLPPLSLLALPSRALREISRHSPQARTPQEYNIKIPIIRATTWRWMQAVNIYHDKYKQSYYNDKHQDPTVMEDRAEYIKVMDKLMIRQPLWLYNWQCMSSGPSRTTCHLMDC